MQLSRHRRAVTLWREAITLATCAVVLVAGESEASAQSDLDLGTTVYFEKGGPLEMMVITPGVGTSVDVGGDVHVDAAWEADVVTGASVAVVDAPGDLDAITSATTLDDVRHVISGGAGVESEGATIDVHYSYGFESDYVSHGLSVAAGADLFDRNTTLQISYARNWDGVCDLVQPDAQRPVERQRLPSSDGCFSSAERTKRKVSVQTVQGTWTQAWAPVFNTQLVLTSQVLNGFQSNPYRAVWLGRTAAQEHHPENRARYAAGLRARLWLKPIGGAIQLAGRGYRDTWDVVSASGEAAYQRNLGDWLRFRVRGRYYSQGSAAFFSDDYVLAPAGQYFTGDRELSKMSSWMVGGKLEILPMARRDSDGRLTDAVIVLKGNVLFFDFPDFHYGNVPVPTRQAVFGTLTARLTF